MMALGMALVLALALALALGMALVLALALALASGFGLRNGLGSGDGDGDGDGDGSRLADSKEVPAEEMGVVSVKGRIGGYLTDDYRRSETFADIHRRRKKVQKLLAKYGSG